MAYAYVGADALDYFHCRYGGARLLFRGPRRDTGGAYAVALGGTETYGKFIPDPWPTLLETEAGMTVANLGQMNAGIDAYLGDPGVKAVAAAASLRIVQIMGAANLSNRYFTVHPRRNDRLVAPTPDLMALYPEVDFTEFNFTRHLVQTLAALGLDRFSIVARELATVWRQKMMRLLTEIGGPTLLLWLADTPPPLPGARLRLHPGAPMLVDQMMISTIRPLADDLICVMPKRWGGTLEGKVFAPLETPAALTVPGPAAHLQVAKALKTAIERPRNPPLWRS